MSNYNNKTLKSVAEAAAKIMAEKLHPNQQKLDVHEPEKDKLTSADFKKLRSMKKEEVEQIDELSKSTLGSYVKKATRDYGRNKERMGVLKNQDSDHRQKADKRMANINKATDRLAKEGTQPFSQMLESYNEHGLKSIQYMFEEADEQQFKTELEKQKRKAAGTASENEKAKVASAATQAVKVQEESGKEE
jgi:hypothetical protein